MKCKEWDIMLTLKLKVTKIIKKYIVRIYNKRNSIESLSKYKDDTNSSSLTTTKISNEGINDNKRKINGQNSDENQKLSESKEKYKYLKYLNKDKSLAQQEESSQNKILLSKNAKSSDKIDLKFGKNNEGVELDCSRKPKEYCGNYQTPLGEIKKREDIEKKPKGLYNIGLNSYMNSLLQCLFHIKEVRNFFIENQYQFKIDHPICKAFAEVMYGLQNCNNYFFEPKQFKNIMGKKSYLFLGCKGGDVKDLFINLIDSFLTELNEENSERQSDLGTYLDDSDKSQVFEESKKEVKSYNIITLFILKISKQCIFMIYLFKDFLG